MISCIRCKEDFLKFKNAIEKIDRPVALVVIRGVHNRFADRINPAWKTPLIPIIDKALAGDIEESSRLLSKYTAYDYKSSTLGQNLRRIRDCNLSFML